MARRRSVASGRRLRTTSSTASREVGRDVFVHAELAGVDDAHVHAGAGGVVEEDGVDSLAHGVVAAEGEGDVGDASADVGEWEAALELAGGPDEGDGVVVVFLDAGGDGEDVGVEDDVLGVEADLLGEDAVGAFADGDFALDSVGLAAFVEGHDDDGGSVAPDDARLADELILALLERDGVDDAFSLETLEAGLDDIEAGAVHHDWDAGDVGLGGEEFEVALHGGFGVEHTLVHVDVEDLGSVLDLLAGDGDGVLVTLAADETPEAGGAGDVGALSDVDEVGVGAYFEGLNAAEQGVGARFGSLARWDVGDGVGDGTGVLGSRAAATADDVGKTALGEFAEVGGHVRGGLVVLAELVGEAGVWVAGYEVGGYSSE